MRTYNCPYCRCTFSEADKLWDVATESGQCPECLEPLRNSAITSKRQEEKSLAEQPKRQEESPATRQPYRMRSVLPHPTLAPLSSATTKWTQVSPEEAKRHPLYGVRGWLALFAFSTLFQLLRDLNTINAEFLKVGISFGKLFAVDRPETTLVKQWLAIELLGVLVIYWLLFSKHKSFRPVAMCVILGIWPAISLIAILGASSIPVLVPGLGSALVFDFISWAIYSAIWVTYLQRSERVRITFEHSVKVRQDNVRSDDNTDDVTMRIPGRAYSSEISKPIPSHQPNSQPISSGSDTTDSSQQLSEMLESRLYEQIAQELETGTLDKGLWTKAYAQAGGDDKQTRVLYIKIRFARLLAIENDRRESVRQEKK